MSSDERHLIDDERISDYGRLVEAQRHLHRIFDRSLRSQAGISSIWYEAMLRLARATQGRLSTSDLGESLVLSSGGVTRLVDRLVERGFVERISDEADRRVVWVSLTPAGFDVLAEATRIHLEDLEEHFVSRLDAAERQTLKKLLRHLRRPPSPS
ncbi:MAG TPA: MarR family transcriptional regulator [Acidimicrobiia bacterium]|nr:MarR family transcriptional regulator [Acidimicrobiia bacterium]